MEGVQELLNNLKRDLIRYKQSKPHLSWRAVSKNSGVNRYFLNKILDENDQADRTKNVDLNQVVLLAKFLRQKMPKDAGIQPQEQEAADAVAIEPLTKFKTPVKSVVFDPYDLRFFIVLGALRRNSKVTYDDIRNVLGRNAESFLDDLIDFGALRIDSVGCLRLVDGKWPPLDVLTHVQARLLSQLLAANSFLPGPATNPHRIAQLEVAFLNERAMGRIHNLFNNFNRAVNAILEDPRSCGNVPTYIGGIFDQLD